jgi:hypothetical protein
MRKHNTLIKIASLGGGAAGLGSIAARDAQKAEEIKAKLEQGKIDDAAYDSKIKGMKAKQEHDKEMRKEAAKRKLKNSANTGDGTGASQGKYKGK